MKNQILIGMLVASSLLVSCSVDQDEGTPITVADDVTTSTDDAGVSGEVQGPDEPLPSTSPTSTTRPLREPDPSESVTTSLPGDPIDETPELPVPGGPLVHPRQPDFTKTTPPPRD